MRIGIALGGGGAKGFSHIGVLRVLQEAGIDCEVVAGTSIGALVGAIYADNNLNRLTAESLAIKLTDIPFLLSPTWSLQGFFSGKSALERLNDFIDSQLIEELPKRFAAVSVALARGTVHVHDKGNLRSAIRASISIPAVFTPVTVSDELYIDGGTVEPVPVEVTRKLGADFVIAVDLFGNDGRPSIEREPSKPAGFQSALNYLRGLAEKLPINIERNRTAVPNIIEIIERTLVLSQRALTEARLKEYPPDLLIQPAVSDIGLLDFHRGRDGIALGEEAARKILPQLQALLVKQGEQKKSSA